VTSISQYGDVPVPMTGFGYCGLVFESHELLFVYGGKTFLGNNSELYM